MVAGLQRALYQQAPEAGAVDEEVGLQLAVILQRDRADKAVLGPLVDRHHHALMAGHTAGFGLLAQEFRIERRVEMEGIGDLRERRIASIYRPHEPGLARRDRLQGILLGRVDGVILAMVLQEEGVKGDPVHIEAIGPEGVDVFVADPAPVLEFDAELEGRLGAANEVVLIDAERAVERADLRNGRLADADRADRFRLHQFDVAIIVLQQLRQRGRRHPAGGPAADNEHFANSTIGHVVTFNQTGGAGQ